MNSSTLCTILVTFGPETLKFVNAVNNSTFFDDTAKIGISHPKYLRISWTYLDLLYRFGRRINGDDYPNIRLAVAHSFY